MKKVILSTAVASLFASTVFGTGVINGSFESPDLAGTVTLNFSQSTKPAGFTWGVIGDIDLIGPNFAVASDGPQFIDVNGWNPGGIYQDITFSESGAWELVFDMSANPDKPGDKGFQIDFGPTNGALSSLGIYSLDSAGRTWSNLQWQTITVALPQVDAGTTYRLQFTTTNSGASGTLLDRVLLQSTGPDCVTAPTDLVSWWQGEGNAVDGAGLNNGTIMGGVSFAPGQVGQAMVFDGASGYVEVQSTPSITPSGPFTVEGWVNYERLTGRWGNTIIAKGADVEGPIDWALTINNGVFGTANRLRPHVRVGGNWLYFDCDTTLTTNTWYHVAMVYDGTTISGFVNGVRDGVRNASGALQTSTNPLKIGVYSPSAPLSTNRFAGLIDELSIYMRALSTNELATIYNAGSAGKCEPEAPEPPCVIPDGMVSWWQGESDFLDSVGDNDGEPIGEVGFMQGMVGKAFVFNGTTGCVQVAAAPSLDVGKGGGLTLECWINPQIATGSQPVVEWNRSDQGSAYGAHLWASIPNRPAGVLFANLLDTNGGWRIIEAPAGTVKTNQLQHIAVTYDQASGLGRLYHNGVVVGEEDLGSFEVKTDRDLFIGCRPNGNFHSAVFKGLIDEVSLYNRALSIVEITAIYEAGSAGKCVPEPPEPPCVLPADIVSWWQGETDATDSVGANHGILTNGASIVPGLVGNAFSFDGIDDSVNIPQSSDLNICNQLTIEFWMKASPSNSMDTYQGLVTSDFYGIEIANGFALGPLGVSFFISTDSGGSLSSSSWPATATANGGGAVVSAGEWHHVAGTYDGSKLQLYIDGAPWGEPAFHSGAISPMLSNSFVTIGSEDGRTICDFCMGTRHFDGLIDEPSIYSRALSEAEIAAIYEAGSAGKCPPEPPPSTFLVNVDFSSGAGPSPKSGLAATGQMADDFWNLYTRDDGAGGWRSFGAVPNLKEADGTTTTVGLTVANAPGAWSIGSSDPMYNTYIYPNPPSSGNATITLTNLPQGEYDLYVYSADGNFELTVDATSYGVSHSLENPVSNPPVWEEGKQYALFTNVAVGGGQPLVLTVRPGVHGYATVSGLQISGATSEEETAPVIVDQPLNQSVPVGGTASFVVGATGAQPLGFQWFKEDSIIADATNSTLVLQDVLLADAGEYSVLVSNQLGTATSSNALLTVTEVVCVDAPEAIGAWWKGEGNADDSIGGNNGTVHGGVSFGAGKVGQALLFDGNNGYVEVVSNPATTPNGPFTIETWVNLERIPTGAGSAIVAKGIDTETAIDWALTITPARKLRPHVKVGSSWRYFDCDTVLSTGVWLHVAMVYDGTSLKGMVNGDTDGSIAASGALQTSAHTLKIGAYAPLNGTISKGWFGGKIDELSLYHRALSTNELAAIYQAGSAGKCEPEPAPPFIVNQPQDQSVPVGGTATFNVGAVGAQPLAYQWFKESSALENATNSALNLQNVQLADAGDYSVVVSNHLGSATSSNAVLTVTMPPANISVVSTSAPGGGLITIPIRLRANGNENALGFSISHILPRESTPIAFMGASRGDGASDAVLIVSTNQAALGRIGVALSMPADETFAAGTEEIVNLHFWSSPVSQPTMIPFSFTDSPTVRQVADVEANTLPATYSSGMLTLLPADLESDLTPRPTGNRSVTITDWVQAGRFAARLDTPAAGGEFQRADSAPRSTRGDGQIKVTDWVQAGRNVVGMDPLLAVGGPTEPVPSSGGSGDRVRIASAGRAIRIVPLNGAIQNEISTLAALLESEGDENALGFSLVFDPSAFTFAGASLGDDAAEAKMNVNATEAPSGRIGIVLALPTGNSFAPGSREVLKIEMQTADADGEHSLAFDDFPVLRSVSDPNAEELGASYLNSTITINPLPKLSVNYSGTNVILSWPDWAGDFTLQVSSDLTDGWSNAAQLPETNGNSLNISLPIKEDQQLFRLRGP